MDQERENQESSEIKTAVDSQSNDGESRVNKFIESLSEVEEGSGEIEEGRESAMSQDETVENETESDSESNESEDSGPPAEIKDQASETPKNNESPEVPKVEDTPIEDPQAVDKNENNTEKDKADPLENIGTDKEPSPDKIESEPDSVDQNAVGHT